MKHHICVTGTIGTGKSYISKLFEKLGYARFCADSCVHQLFREPEIIRELQEKFPMAIKDGVVNRQILGKLVYESELYRHELESLIHPLVFERRYKFAQQMMRQGRACVFDIPLYFEANMWLPHTKIVVTTAPLFLIKARVLKRGNLTTQMLDKVISLQMPDRAKQRRADFVISTGLSKMYSWQQVKKVTMSVDKTSA